MCPRSVPRVQPEAKYLSPAEIWCFHFLPEALRDMILHGIQLPVHQTGRRFMNLTQYIESKRDDHLSELFEFLRIPSVSAQSDHKPDIERAAKWVANRLGAAGLENVEIIPTKMHPLVYAESLHPPGKPTMRFYGHSDAQPA